MWLISEHRSERALSSPTIAAEETEAFKKTLPGGRRVAVSERRPREPRSRGLLVTGSSCSDWEGRVEQELVGGSWAHSLQETVKNVNLLRLPSAWASFLFPAALKSRLDTLVKEMQLPGWHFMLLQEAWPTRRPPAFLPLEHGWAQHQGSLPLPTKRQTGRAASPR